MPVNVVGKADLYYLNFYAKKTEGLIRQTA